MTMRAHAHAHGTMPDRSATPSMLMMGATTTTATKQDRDASHPQTDSNRNHCGQ